MSPAPSASVSQEPLTLKARVAAFWEWYRSVAERFYSEIEAARCYDLEPEVSAKLHELLPGMMWVFGPGANDEGHSFTLTPEGNDHLRFVAHYWLSQAPSLPGWTFYSSRQPSNLSRTITIDDREFAPHEVWLTPEVDDESKDLDITMWHPQFDQVPEDVRGSVACLWLDEALGEDSARNWIGSLEINNTKLAGAIPLRELPEFITSLQVQKGWQKYPPYERWSAYELTERRPRELRGDIIVGKTLTMEIVNGYPFETNPLADLGAEYAMVVFPFRMLPLGGQVQRRSELEYLLTEVLQQEASGRVIGGAMGSSNAYIDLILFDGQNSRDLVKRTLAGTELAGNFRLLNFLEQYKTHSGGD